MRRMNRNISNSIRVRVRVMVRVWSLLLDLDFDGAHPHSTTLFCRRPSAIK